uniref:Uncharacterized protein n=1 Tax=Parascaris univalens TaxID=6257 RepID=A0A915AKY4_PARUN
MNSIRNVVYLITAADSNCSNNALQLFAAENIHHKMFEEKIFSMHESYRV